jgi:hypothetical protein
MAAGDRDRERDIEIERERQCVSAREQRGVDE